MLYTHRYIISLGIYRILIYSKIQRTYPYQYQIVIGVTYFFNSLPYVVKEKIH